MVAGKSNVSKYRNTTDVAWMPAPPEKKKTGLGQTLNQKRKYTNYVSGGGTKDFEDWLKTQ